MGNTSWRDKDYITINDIGNILGISRKTVYRNVIGQLPMVKVGKRYRIARPAFEQWLKNQERGAANG